MADYSGKHEPSKADVKALLKQLKRDFHLKNKPSPLPLWLFAAMFVIAVLVLGIIACESSDISGYNADYNQYLSDFQAGNIPG